MSQIFLIQVPFLNDYGPMKNAAGTYFPLGLGYLAANAKKHGYQVRFFDFNVQDIRPQQVAQAALQEKPLLIGLSFMTPQFEAASELCRTIKETCPNIPIVLGGVHPSVMPTTTLAEIPDADFVVVDEGEETLIDLLSAITTSADLSKVKGLVYRDNGKIIETGPRELIKNLDSLPFPDRDLIDQSLYRHKSYLTCSHKAANIYTSRGCTGHCVFCCSGYQLHHPVRERSIDNIMREIKYLSHQLSIDYLVIMDDSFTVNKPRVEEFCAAIHKIQPKLKWFCMSCVNTVDYDLLSKMKAAGLNDILFGIESGNNNILKKARKGITTKQVRHAVELCHKLAIRTYGSFILGLPGDSKETIEETIAFACSLPLTIAEFSIMTPYPGTRAFKEYYQIGANGVIDYKNLIATTGIHYTPRYSGLSGLKPSDLPQFISKAQRRFYLRPLQLWRILRSSNPTKISGYLRGFTALITKELYLKRRVANIA